MFSLSSTGKSNSAGFSLGGSPNSFLLLASPMGKWAYLYKDKSESGVRLKWSRRFNKINHSQIIFEKQTQSEKRQHGNHYRLRRWNEEYFNWSRDVFTNFHLEPDISA